eukprot:m.240649 g.240649  ORF g.240649 m.240649 type:complete len:523 (-) comp23519_c0_seq1:35-1603(-)
MTVLPVFGLLLCLFFSQARAAVDTDVVVNWILNHSKYDNLTRPFLEEQVPVQIAVQFRLNHLYNVDAVTNTFSIDVFTRLHWTDPRLAFNTTWRKTIRVAPEMVWRPDLVYYNGITAQTFAEVVEIASDGTVFWGRQQLLTMAASLDLHEFPFDQQTVTLVLVSLSYDTVDLNTTLYQGAGVFPDPIAYFKSSVWMMTGTTSTVNHMQLREFDPNPYAFTRVSFNITRQFDTYVVKYMMLLGFLVFLSALSYCIDAGSAPARVACSFILVVALAAFNIYVSKDLPKLSYATFMDQYVLVCFAYALVSVFEYATVNYFITQPQKELVTIGKNMDRFFMFTAPPMWLLVLFLFFIFSTGTVIAMIVVWLVWLAFGFRHVVLALSLRFKDAWETFVTRHMSRGHRSESVPLQDLAAPTGGAAAGAAVAEAVLGGATTGSNTANESDASDELIADVPVAIEEDLDDEDEEAAAALADSEADALSVRSVTYLVEEEPASQEIPQTLSSSPNPNDGDPQLPGAVPDSL